MDTTVRPGMLVKLRRRIWRIEDVAGGIASATPIDDFGADSQRFLLELEDVEPGTLPEPPLEALGDYALQRLFLQAVRLDALHGTAPFVSIQRVGIIPGEYQLVPLVMALRQQPVRLLIADTIGLGKTIEAGLIAKELLARNQARSVLVLTPANLREQWRQQMRDLFYLDFEVVSSETRKRLERSIPPGADPWLYFDRLIVSMDYAKTPRVKHELLKRKWDVVIVDEAHNASMPHSQMGRKADMERWELIDQIAAKASNHLLLLTATPHNGYTDSYSSLLKMLSRDLVYGNGADLKPNRERAISHVCQRTRNDIQRWFDEAGRPFPFPQREPEAQTEVPVTLAKEYAALLQQLDDVMDLVEAHARVMNKQQPVEWLRLHLHRRALSSPEALRKSLENRIAKLKQEAVEEKSADTEEAEENLVLASLGDRGSEDADTEDEADRRVDSVALRIDQQLQLTHFGTVLSKLKTIKPGSDRKLAKLRDEVIPSLMAKASDKTPSRVIIFTRYKDTLDYLEKELSGKRAGFEVLSLHGDLSEAMRDEQFRKFAEAKSAVLIATDVISEGMNLQATSCMVVHYDIPWNPNRMEQRAGRVDRYGQRSPYVYIRTVFCKDTQDEDVLDLYVRKFASIRHDLGATPPLFASEDTVRRIIMRRQRRKGTVADQPGLFDEDAFINEALNRIKSDGFYGQTNIHIAEVADRLEDAYARFGNPREIQRFLEIGLRRYGCSIQEAKDGLYKMEIKNPRLQVAGIPRILDQVVLDPNLRQLYPEAVVLDVGHPLSRRLSAVIREDTLRTTSDGARVAGYEAKGQRGTVLLGHGLLRATAKTKPAALLEEIVVFGIRSGLEGVTLLSPDEARTASVSDSTERRPDRAETFDRLKTLRENPAWDQAQQAAMKDALARLQGHRSKLKTELLRDNAHDQDWLSGFDDVEEVGFDLHCLTILLPEAR